MLAELIHIYFVLMICLFGLKAGAEFKRKVFGIALQKGALAYSLVLIHNRLIIALFGTLAMYGIWIGEVRFWEYDGIAILFVLSNLMTIFVILMVPLAFLSLYEMIRYFMGNGQ